jgi:hypothetical protein
MWPGNSRADLTVWNPAPAAQALTFSQVDFGTGRYYGGSGFSPIQSADAADDGPESGKVINIETTVPAHSTMQFETLYDSLVGNWSDSCRINTIPAPVG